MLPLISDCVGNIYTSYLELVLFLFQKNFSFINQRLNSDRKFGIILACMDRESKNTLQILIKIRGIHSMKKASKISVSNTFKKLLRVLSASLILPLCTYGSAHALVIQNGSFETNGIEFWGTSGRTVETPASQNPYTGAVFLPTDGMRFAKLTTDASIWQDISWDDGDILSLNLLFYTTEGSNWGKNDFAWMKIDNLDIYRKTKSQIVSHPTDGWEDFTYAFGASGSGRLQIGVKNAGDSYYGSYLYLDNIRGTSVVPPQGEIPEPTSLLLLGVGLAGLAASRRRKSV